MLRYSLLTPLLYNCTQSNDALPKPYGNLRLEYPTPSYKPLQSSCPFTFEYEKNAIVQPREEGCRFNLYYPQLKATIYLTYEPINKNLPALLSDAEKSVYLPHTAKASYIDTKNIIRPKNHVFGTLYELGGEAALNYQFHLTDSTKNFLRGAVYFSAHPNPDSLAPAINYMKENVVKLMESITWK